MEKKKIINIENKFKKISKELDELKTNLFLNIFDNPPNDDRYKLIIPNSLQEIEELIEIYSFNPSYNIDSAKNGDIYFAAIYDNKNGNVPVQYLNICIKNNMYFRNTLSTMWTDISEAIPIEVEKKFFDYMINQIDDIKEIKNIIDAL